MAIGELPIRRRSRFSFIIPSLTLLMGSTWNYNRAVCTKYLLVMTELLMKHHVNLFGQETLSLLLVPVEVTQYFPSVFCVSSLTLQTGLTFNLQSQYCTKEVLLLLIIVNELSLAFRHLHHKQALHPTCNLDTVSSNYSYYLYYCQRRFIILTGVYNFQRHCVCCESIGQFERQIGQNRNVCFVCFVRSFVSDI